MDWEKITPALNGKLDPKRVKKPDSKWGPKGDYIEAWDAINKANEVFGFGGWSYTIINLDQASLAQGKTSKGEDQWQAAYTCTVRLMVGDTIREDVGFGSGFARQIGDAVEGATKEAVTDALKRCLRTFGNQFGLALYDKSKANVGYDAPPEPQTTGTGRRTPDAPTDPNGEFEHAQEHIALTKLVRAQKTLDDLNELITTERFNEFKEAAPFLAGQLRGEIKAQMNAIKAIANVAAA